MTDYPSSIKLRLCNIFYAIFCDVQLLLIQTMPSHSRWIYVRNNWFTNLLFVINEIQDIIHNCQECNEQKVSITLADGNKKR